MAMAIMVCMVFYFELASQLALEWTYGVRERRAPTCGTSSTQSRR
jgi:hypothetical protein